jgi:hydrogenase nickel incorporation protein HypA/HybF
MHDLAMAQDILKTVLTEAERGDTKRIKAINIRMVDDHFHSSDSIQFCLKMATEGTIAEGAHIEIDCVERTVECPECAFIFPVDNRLPICPICGHRAPEMVTVDHPIQIELEIE